jgi:pilus assembly protein CpaF
MFTIIIQEKGGEQRRMVFNKPEVTIGRVQGNDIVLPKGNVSKRHARIVLKDGKFIIVDLKSTNGTYVNGRKITSPLVVKDSDKIYIGDFIVGVDESAGEGESPSENVSERLPSSSPVDVRPPRPTEAQPMSMDRISGMGPGMMGGGMGGGPGMQMGSAPMAMPMPPEPAPPPIAPPMSPRPGPPRPAPGPSRELAVPERNPIGSPPMPSAVPAGGPGLGSGPAPGTPRGLGRPGGTMPPPMAPIPAAPMPPQAPAPGPTVADVEHRPPPLAPRPLDPLGALDGGGQMAAPAPMPAPVPRAPLPSAAPMPSARPEPAAVVPLPSANQAARPRGIASVGSVARRSIGRSVSLPSRRGLRIDPLDPKVVKMLDLQSNILERLRAKLDLDKIPLERLHEEELWQRAERATIDLVEQLETSGELPKYIDQDTLIKETLSEALALGPLEDLLADDKIDEIVIDRRDRVVVGKDGQLRGSGKAFSSDEMFERVVKRLVAEAGASIDDTNPLVDLRMRDGTRLTAAVSPVASRGACLVLRKAPTAMPQLSDLVIQNALSTHMADFLSMCVTARRNVLICGGAGSGKTTVMAALAAASPAGERVVSIEEVAELTMQRDEWIQLEARPGSGRHPTIDLGHLLETALRLTPDRLVVGDVKGREALPLLTALCSSVDGAVVTMHGEGAATVLGRLVTLARIGAANASDLALRELVASAFEIVIHVVRTVDGHVRVLAIEEIVGCSEHGIETNPLFQFANGAFTATGTVPRFYAELEARGIPADQAVFR